MRAALAGGFGVLALVDDQPAGVVIVSIANDVAGVHRVSVRPSFQRLGIASAMVTVVLEELTGQAVHRVQLVARAEFPQVVAWWQRHGFVEVGRVGTSLTLAGSCRCASPPPPLRTPSRSDGGWRNWCGPVTC